MKSNISKIHSGNRSQSKKDMEHGSSVLFYSKLSFDIPRDRPKIKRVNGGLPAVHPQMPT